MSDNDAPGGEAGNAAPDSRDKGPEPEYFRGERGRTVPRSAWWILAVGLVLLLAFVIARPTWFERDDDDDNLDVPADRYYAKSLSSAGDDDGVWLSDDSPSTSLLVTFPADSERTETRLKLVGTSQVAEDSVVFLTIRMDGQQVYKSELPSGTNPLEALIDVPEQQSSDGQVRIQAQVQGTLSDRTCLPDHSAGMQVHLDSASVVEAALDEPIHTVRDAVVSWDRRITIVLADSGDEWRATAAQLGIALTRAGHEVTYSEEVPDSDVQNTILVGPQQVLNDLQWSTSSDEASGSIQLGSVKNAAVVGVLEPDGALVARFLTTPPLSTADSDQTDPQVLATAPPGGNEVGLDEFGTDMSVVQIEESHRWGAGYSLADLPGGRLPQAVRVAFTLPASPDDLTWILNVQLNGQLIDSRRLNASGTSVIALPPSAQLLENSLTLTVQRDRDLGGCDVRLTTYPMQLQTSSALILGDDPGAGFTAVPRDLAGGFVVYVPDADPAGAVDQLNAITPVLTKFIPAQYDPEFRWNADPAPGSPFVLVGQSPGVNTSVRLVGGRLEAGPATPNLNISSFDNGMIVEPTSSGAGGLVVQYEGSPGEIALPAFGNEPSQVVTGQGSFAVYPDGTTRSSDPATANPTR
jgi:cellulose synthase operon protein B